MELTETIKERYQEASKKDKAKILDEFCTNTGYHRKAAIRLINKPPGKRKISGPKVRYPPACTEILKEVWRIMDYICPERFYDEIPGILGRIQDRSPSEYVELVKKMSLMTVRRRIEKLPRPTGRQRKGASAQANYEQIPVNSRLRKATVFGYVGVDFVDHNGGDPSGMFCRSLTLVDVKTLWTTNAACLGRMQTAVTKAFDIAMARFPDTTIHEIHPDNEDALLAVSLLRVEAGKREIFAATRSRPSKKNDNCHVEERNNERVRKHVGYKRYTQKHLSMLNQLYARLDDYCNFFIPSMKLEKKIYNKNHKVVKRVYGNTKTPYQRVLDCKEIDVKVKMALMQKYHKSDILKLRDEIDQLLKVLIRT